MNTDKILTMYFLNGSGEQKSITLRNIKDDLTSDDILPVMETLVEENIFATVSLKSIVGAKITTTVTEEIFDDRV